MATKGMCAYNLVLHHTKLLGQCTLQTGAVERSKSGHLTRLEAAVEESNQTGKVSGVEDDDHMLHIGTVGLDVLAQILSNLAVAGQQVLACHTLLTGCTTTGDDILGILECLSHIGSGCDAGVTETALAHFLCHTLGREHVVQADVRGETHHQRALNHVAANHTGGTYNH